ncbi:MAG: hemerythrin domain-containing protein [Gallionellaceae bacterium]|nr:hemerythrin domain-containing protein [Gallionellaceae bacterium]
MAHKGRYPAWLYESLPYLYIGAGVVVIVVLGNVIAVYSGLMLIAAGLLVARLRYSYRHRPRRAGARAAPGLAAGGLQPLAWSREFECGIPSVDAQHRSLFEAANAVLGAIADDQGKLDVELMFDDLIAQLERHFHAEEVLWRQKLRPGCHEHEETHRQLLARAKLLSGSYHDGGATAGQLYAFVADKVIAQHIRNNDRQMV